MTGFFSGPLFESSALMPYEYVWRLDSDSFLLAPPAADPLAQLAAANGTYGWVHAFQDEQLFVSGLWNLTARFLSSRGIDEGAVHEWVPQGRRWPESPMCFATNCFVARRRWFTSPPYSDYFRALDEAGGFYLHRWGDACVHMLAVAAMLPRSEVVHLHSLAYWHQGTVRLPSHLEPYARRPLQERGLEPPPFDAAVGPPPLAPPRRRELSGVESEVVRAVVLPSATDIGH